MNPDTLNQTIQKGFRVTLGATASLLDALRDPQGSQAKFSEIGSDVDRLTEELESRGAETEQEARTLVDELLHQVPNPFEESTGSNRTVDTVATSVTDASTQAELEALTQELSTLRQEIDALKSQQQG